MKNSIKKEKTESNNITIESFNESPKQHEKILVKWQTDLLNLSSEAIFAWELFGGIIYWNAGAEAMYGYSNNEAIGCIGHELLKTVHLSGIGEIHQILNKNGVWEGEFDHTSKFGKKIIVETRLQVIVNEQGQKIVLETNRDITERKLAEKKLSYQNIILKSINLVYEKSIQCETLEKLGEAYLDIVEAITGSKFSFIGEIGPDGMYYDIAVSNPGWELCNMRDKTGHRRASNSSEIHGLFGSVLKSGKSLITNSPSTHPDSIGVPKGHPKLSAFLGVPFLQNGKVIGMIGVGNRESGYELEHQEILEALTPTIIEVMLRKRTEIQLMEAKAHAEHQRAELEVIIENMPDAFAFYNKDGKIILLNAEARKLYPNLAIQKAVAEVHSEFEYFDLQNNIISRDMLPTRRAFRGEIIRNERVAIKKPDKVQITEINATPIFDEDNNLCSVVVSHTDITEFHMSQEDNKLKQHQLLLAEKAKNEALEEAIKLKDEFFYLITHEFKTPIAVINLALQALDYICKEEVTEKVGGYLNTIKQNVNRQLRLVNNLLDISRINSGHLKMNYNYFNIPEVVSAIVSSVQLYAQQKSVRLIFKSELSERIIYSDEEKLERILLNLLSNALKFTTENKSIIVTLSEEVQNDNCAIILSVKDEGMGIPKSKQQTIFERFEQVDSSLSRHAEGSGLGLYLVKLLISSLGGEISLESTVNKGSTFIVRLPSVKALASDEVSACMDNGNQFLSSDNRIIQSTAIEFSDIYF